jgi:hypothetical protein
VPGQRSKWLPIRTVLPLTMHPRRTMPTGRREMMPTVKMLRRGGGIDRRAIGTLPVSVAQSRFEIQRCNRSIIEFPGSRRDILSGSFGNHSARRMIRMSYRMHHHLVPAVTGMNRSRRIQFGIFPGHRGAANCLPDFPVITVPAAGMPVLNGVTFGRTVVTARFSPFPASAKEQQG